MIRLNINKLTDIEKRKLYIGMARTSKEARLLAQKNVSITEEVVKKLHKTIFNNVFPAIAGTYRRGPIQAFASGHEPPPAEHVPQHMRNFMLDLIERSKHAQPVHLVGGVPKHKAELIAAINNVLELTAYAHWRLVWIHPFTDGNGRTARILSNLLLERYGLRPIPTTVHILEKEQYIRALHEADKHNLDPLITLIALKEHEEIEKHGLAWTIEPVHS